MSQFNDDWWRPPPRVLSPQEEKDRWSVGQYIEWLDPQMVELLKNRKKNWTKIQRLMKDFGYYLFKIWYGRSHQMFEDAELNLWKYWAECWEITEEDFNFDWYWYQIYL